MRSSEYRQKHQADSTELINTGVIVHDATPAQKQPCLSWLHHIWEYLRHSFLQGDKPRIWEKRNSDGEVLYYGYDPRSGNSIQGVNAADMRTWLEQLPYSW